MDTLVLHTAGRGFEVPQLFLRERELGGWDFGVLIHSEIRWGIQEANYSVWKNLQNKERDQLGQSDRS